MSSPSGVPSTMTGSGGGGGGSSSTTSTPTSTTTPTTSSATSVTTAATKPSATATTASTTSASTSLAPSSRAEDATRRLSAEIDRDQFILLNVGGELINTSRQTLTLDSNSVLGRMFAQDANIGCKRDAGGAVLIDRVRPSNQSRINGESIANLYLVCHSHSRRCLGSAVLSCVAQLPAVRQVDSRRRHQSRGRSRGGRVLSAQVVGAGHSQLQTT